MISVVRGMRDLFGPELRAWQRAEEVFRTTSASFGYEELRTPILEHTELFARGVGQETDIVGKEMYSFEDRGGDSVTLRPEMTAAIVRAAIEHNFVRHSPTTRIWYAGPQFRYERPQKGRYRQFHQYGAECLGSPHPEADVEIIQLAYSVLQTIGVTKFTLEVNTLGSTTSRAAYREALVTYLRANVERLSEDSQRRLERNPLRVLDSKDEQDKPVIAEAPKLVDYLDVESRQHFESVRLMLDVAGIPYVHNPLLVRGLDYYCHTVFEFTTTELGTQNAIGGGGRYDPLFALIGGTDTPAVGFSLGVERVMMLLEQERGEWGAEKGIDVFAIAIGDAARLPLRLISLRLRRQGYSVVEDLQRRSVKAQMRDADKHGARYTITMGDDELAQGNVVIKNMATGEQQSVADTNVEQFLTRP